jgi:hypothetical protein
VDSELNSQHALRGVVHGPSVPECTRAPTALALENAMRGENLRLSDALLWSGTQCGLFSLASISWCNGASEARPADPGEAAKTEDAGPGKEWPLESAWPPAESAFRRDHHHGVEPHWNHEVTAARPASPSLGPRRRSA